MNWAASATRMDSSLGGFAHVSSNSALVALESSFAPALTHARRISFSFAVSCGDLRGGMYGLFFHSVVVTSRLLSGSPGVTSLRPLVLPFMMCSYVSRFSPPLILPVRWHSTQYFLSNGWTSLT